MNIPVVEFHFKTPLHISNAKADYGTSETMIHSDTLYSAILHAWGVLGIPIEPNWQANFAISSLFPFTKDEINNKTVFFFPKPYGLLNFQSNKKQAEPNTKALKKIDYYDEYYFKLFLKKELFHEYGTNHQDIQGKYLSSKVIKPFMDSHVSPRIRAKRYGHGDPEIFYTERIQFKNDSGLYCLFLCENKTTEENIRIALEYLADEGLGTDRHLGNGLFDFKFKEQSIDFSDIDDSEYLINLSLFSPEGEDETHLTSCLDLDNDNPNIVYEIVKRGGWITQEGMMSFKKKPIYMFREGCTISSKAIDNNIAGIKVGGEVVNVTPQIVKEQDRHPIFRVGKSIFLPVKI